MQVRIRLTLLAALVGVLAVFVVGTGTGSARATQSKSKSTKLKCVTEDFNQTPGKLKGLSFGVATCSKPWGRGLEAISYTETVSSTGAVSSKGAFKNYYNTGTTHGVYSLSGKFTSATSGTLSGPVTITGGTGAFKGAKGKGKLTCKTTNGGNTSTCTAVVNQTAV